MAADRLDIYRAKRDFTKTGEPAGAHKSAREAKGHSYLIQKHEARNLHFDFRLEHEGVLKSWAIPRGPSMDPGDKRLAVRTEDHPLEYGRFEGSIPKGQYGGGTVMLWDEGSWEPIEDPDEGLKEGKLKFIVHGQRLQGGFALVRLRSDTGRKQGKENWLLIKEKDEHARPGEGGNLIESQLTSVRTEREMEEISQGEAEWHSNEPVEANVKRLKTVKRAAGARRSPRQRSTSPRRAVKKMASAKKKRKRKRVLPEFVAPQLATLVDTPPSGTGWLHEIKLDGYRAITAIGADEVRVFTRNGLDWSGKFAPLVPALKQLDCESALLDGEIAVADKQGHTDFGALQDALSTGRGGFAYYLFDLLERDGEDLRKQPLKDRKRLLEALIKPVIGKGPLAYSEHVKGSGGDVFARACDLKLEGIISKRADAPYRSGRQATWLKSKCGMEQEFVIIGWRPSDKAGRAFSSLLLAVREEGKLRYAGRVGSGYSGARLEELETQFRKLARPNAPVDDVPPAIARHARFVEPKLVAEIEFRGWTRDGLVRQGAFKGLREDKPAAAVVREKPMPKKKAAKLAAQSRKASPVRAVSRSKEEDIIEGVRVTHPDKVLFADREVTKRDLIDHYIAVADRMLPHIANRPISLVRCPDGEGGECFFQKHASKGFPGEFRAVPIRESAGKRDYLYIEDLQGLIAAVQMGALELHVWGTHVDAVEEPDRMVFDFDPDEAVDFAMVKQAAKDMHKRLKSLGLESYPMATGGKGIHVVVPLARGHSWDQHRDFAEALARLTADEEPERFVATMSKAKRKGKIFVDYLRNTRGATAIAPFSSRAKKGAPFAVPLSWQSLGKLGHAHPYSVGDAPRGDPWKGYAKFKQKLPKLR
jgi:bifunctional non-homologous end joining protein LigD